jgi:hypothetical protein
MRHISISLIIILFLQVGCSSSYVTLSIPESFESNISGSTWSYEWRGRNYIFTFESDGTISKLSSWSSVSWNVTGTNEITLEAHSSKMYLFFNDDLTEFVTLDWDGQKASGIRMIHKQK